MRPARSVDFGSRLSSCLAPLGTVPATAGDQHVLGVVDYGTGTHGPIVDRGYPQLRIHMARTAELAFQEVWSTDRPVTVGTHAGLHYGHDGEFLFCAGRIAPGSRYAQATRTAYLESFALTRELGYRNIFRMWNFVADINAGNADGLEIYRDFCLGRAEAFAEFPVELGMPAATGIGALSGGIGFYFLAGATADRINLENPRQRPAYRYPQRYGPRPPSFARATCLQTGLAGPATGSALGSSVTPATRPTTDSPAPRQIFISGTASIVGHRTMHAHDIRSQCIETFTNIAQLISATNLANYGIGHGYELTDLTNLKVYVRHRKDLDTVRGLCREVFAATAEIAFLNVDICRSDLLVEIEGIIPARGLPIGSTT